jgi:hypothetical protein
MPLRFSCVCGLCSRSLFNNGIGDAGAAAIGAGLVHLPQLQTLKYDVGPAVCTGPWCVLARERGAMACACACTVVCAICAGAALAITISVTRVRRPSVQPWSTFPSCRHWSTLCARLCVRGRGVCLHGNAGPWHAPALCCCVCGLCSCSLFNNGIGDAGAAAIGAALVHLPQLQTLKYVVGPAMCACRRCARARERGAMACTCACAVCVVCVRAALRTTLSVTLVRRLSVQPWSTCPSCRHWSTLCARLCVRGRGVCLQGNAGPGHALAVLSLCV